MPMAASFMRCGTMRMASSAVSMIVGSISRARATPPAGAENVPVRTAPRGVGEHAGQDRRQPGQHLGGRSARRRRLRVSGPNSARKIAARMPMGTLMRRGDGDDDQRAEQGVADAAAGHAGGGRQLGEQCEADLLAAVARSAGSSTEASGTMASDADDAGEDAHGITEQRPRRTQGYFPAAAGRFPCPDRRAGAGELT